MHLGFLAVFVVLTHSACDDVTNKRNSNPGNPSPLPGEYKYTATIGKLLILKLRSSESCFEKVEDIASLLEQMIEEHNNLEFRLATLEEEWDVLVDTKTRDNHVVPVGTQYATKDDLRDLIQHVEGKAMKRWFGEDMYDSLRRIADYVDDIVDFFANTYNKVKDFIADLYYRVYNCFSNLENCFRPVLEYMVYPALEAMKDSFFMMLNIGPGIGGPVEVWQGMAHQLRLGQTGKCVGYDDFELVVEDCYDPSSTLKHHFSQDFKLTPCDNCHDTELNLLDILEFMIRICNFGDANTERNWSAMIEMSTFGHVIARGRIEQSGDNSGHFVGEKPAPFPLSLFTRMITLEAYVTLTSNQVHFSITAIYSNPSVYFVDEFCSPLMTSFVIPLVASVNSGGFKEFDDSRSSLLCRNDCYNTYNGLCDDGGPGSDFDLCWYGSDCYDCGARPVLCTNGCEFPHDGLCDDGGYNSDYYVCNYGDDCADCGVRVPES